MSTVLLPTKSDGTQRYNFRCALGGTVFGFEFRWNARDSGWYFRISDANDQTLLTKKIAIGSPVFARAMDLRLPSGELIAIDTGGKDAEPGLTDLGSRVVLAFTDRGDISALIA